MRLSDGRRLEPRALQRLHYGGPARIDLACFFSATFRRVGRRGLVVVEKVQIIRMPSRDERGPGRLADGALAPCPSKPHRPIRQRIEVRRLNRRMACTAHHVMAVLIRENEQNVGL